MYGTNRELRTVQCAICKRWYALRADRDDIARVLYGGALVQDALPYLSDIERELLLTATCGPCWDLLCPSDPLSYN